LSDTHLSRFKILNRDHDRDLKIKNDPPDRDQKFPGDPRDRVAKRKNAIVRTCSPDQKPLQIQKTGSENHDLVQVKPDRPG
jgi:hypothetical protein